MLNGGCIKPKVFILKQLFQHVLNWSRVFEENTTWWLFQSSGGEKEVIVYQITIDNLVMPVINKSWKVGAFTCRTICHPRNSPNNIKIHSTSQWFFWEESQIFFLSIFWGIKIYFYIVSITSSKGSPLYRVVYHFFVWL